MNVECVKELSFQLIEVVAMMSWKELIDKVDIGMLDNTRTSMRLVVESMSKLMLHIVLNTFIDKGFAQPKDPTNVLYFVSLPKVKERDAGLDIIGFLMALIIGHEENSV